MHKRASRNLHMASLHQEKRLLISTLLLVPNPMVKEWKAALQDNALRLATALSPFELIH